MVSFEKPEYATFGASVYVKIVKDNDRIDAVNTFKNLKTVVLMVVIKIANRCQASKVKPFGGGENHKKRKNPRSKNFGNIFLLMVFFGMLTLCHMIFLLQIKLLFFLSQRNKQNKFFILKLTPDYYCTTR